MGIETGAFNISNYELILGELGVLAGQGKIFIAGDSIINAHEPGGWFEMCHIVVSPTRLTLDPEQLNTFTTSILTIQPTITDLAIQANPNAQLRLPSLGFDEVIGTITTDMRRYVELHLQSLTDLNVPEEERTVEELRRRTLLKVCPDPISADLIYKFMKGDLTGNTEYISEYWLYPEQIARLRQQYKRQNPLRHLLGR